MGILTTVLGPGYKLLRKGKLSKKTPLSSYTHSEMFSSLFEHHPDAIFTLDLNGHFISSNHRVENFIGYKENELKGSFLPLLKKEDIERVSKHFKEGITGVPQNYNCEVIHKNGHYVRLNITNLPFKVSGEIIGLYGFAKDLTNIKRTEDELLKITNSLDLAQQVASMGSWEYDPEKDYVYCSKPLYSILGIQVKENLPTKYQNLLQMIIPEDRAQFDSHFQQIKKTGETIDINYRVKKADNTVITVHVRAQAVTNDAGRIIKIIGVLHDVSEQVLAENKLKESEEKFKNIANNLDVGIWSFDCLAKKIVYASTGVEKITGVSSQEFESGAIKWEDLVYKQDIPAYMDEHKDLSKGSIIQHQYRITDACGNVKWVEDKIFPIFNSKGLLVRIDGIVQDINERKHAEEKINFYAFHDYLTELPNRRRFDTKVNHLISGNEVMAEPFSLMYLDLDRFKFVNDTLGHVIGDELLCQVSKRLSSFVGDVDSLFRIGGDEFALILKDGKKNLVEMGEQIIKEIEKPFQIEGYDIHITTSIGIGVFPEDGLTLKDLKMNTDAALYRAKELGKNNVQLFTKTMNIESYKLFTLDNDLRKAIVRDELFLHYQPRVEASNGKMVGAEALIRWNHPKWGIVSPIEFIPLAEESGLINEIGDYVLSQVCKQLKEWEQSGCPLVPISINLSAKSLMKADLVPNIIKHLTENQIDPSLLEIEITENSIIQNEASVLATLKVLKEMGIRISLDDFGTGYSSIGYLKRFNIDYIKIDRSYIKDILGNQEDLMIVKSIILLAKGFQLKVVAEGVESLQQWELLKELECHFIQGYLFSKPIPAEELGQLLLNKGRLLRPQSYPTMIQNTTIKYDRIEFLSPQEADMTIDMIKGDKINIGNTKVRILSLGSEGLSFTTHLQLPVSKGMTLKFVTRTIGEALELKGYILSKEEKHNNQFYYDVKYTN
jgi:diguanylate cyclase (GGDEF)-like protein/PAS domain S-box-containing protein